MAEVQMDIQPVSGAVEEQREELSFHIGRILRLGSFHIGSAMGDILLAGIWNRIMISDFGIPAWPIGLLIALKNFMAPISIWVGHRSDTRPLWGWRRTPYIWMGRFLMVLAFPLVGAATIRLENATGDIAGWAIATLAFLLFGFGSLISGSPFLALVRDSAPRSKQGLSIAIVESVLIALFPVVALGFSRMLVNYDQALFWRLVLTVTVVGGFFWWFSVAGAEKRNVRLAGRPLMAERPQFKLTLAAIWRDGRTRWFFAFLFLATLSAWMQDNILEPFGADVFDLRVAETTRFTSYWGTATLVVLFSSFYIWRRRRPENLSGVTWVGLVIMAGGKLLLLGSALYADSSLLYTGLLVFGFGFGLYSFGGLSLMAVMSPNPHSGAYLGLWTVAILVSRGLGIFLGGVSRDIWLALDLTQGVAYGLTFAISAAGLLSAAAIISQLDVLGFARSHEKV